MKKDTVPFDKAFQEIAVASLLKKNPSFVVRRLLAPQHVEVKSLKVIVTLYCKLTRKLGTYPTYITVRDQLKKTKLYSGQEKRYLIEELRNLRVFKIKRKDLIYLENELADFVRYQNVLNVLNGKAVDLLKQKRLDELNLELVKAFKRLEEQDKAVNYFQDYKTRFKQRFAKKHKQTLKTLIPELDCKLKGEGVDYGTLNVVLASTGAGKSMLLVYLAKAAVIQKKKVLYITLQLTADQIAERLDANFSGMTIYDASQNVDKVVNVIQKKSAVYGNSLKIKFFPSMSLTVSDLRAYLEQEKTEEDFSPDLVVIDYGDLMIGTDSVKDGSGRYYESGSVFDELLGLAQEKNFVLWTASQTNRGGLSAKLLTLDFVAESMRKLMAAQLVVTITRSPEEKKENKARLFIAKNSFGEDEFQITVNTAYHKGSFFKIKPAD